MHFKIKKSLFYNSLLIVQKAVASYSPIPALSGIKLDIFKDKIILIGSNSDISIKKEIELNEENFSVINEGSIVIDSKYLLDIVRKIDHDEIEVELIDGSLTKFRGLSTQFNINGINAFEYPKIDFSSSNQSIKINGGLFTKIINQTKFAASDKEIRPILTGVNITNTSEGLQFIATDSYRLAKKSIAFDNLSNFNITIPSKSLGDISSLFDHNEDVELVIFNNKVQFMFDETIIQTRLIDGVYPETSRLIPTEFDYELVIDSRDLMNAIDRASLIKSDGISIVKMNLSFDELVVSSKSLEIGSSTEKLNSFVYKGEPLEISFSGKYMYEAIKAIDDNEIRICFSGSMKPFIIKGTTDESIVQLVLPVRTHI